MSSLALISCPTSLSEFLSSIPSQASDFAVNTVNHWIEDQVGDPKKLANNLQKVKSVFLRVDKSVHNFEYGGGDCPNCDTTTLLAVPKKIRQHIWRYLDDNAIKTLRSVCQQLKHEVDYEIGLPVVLTPESFNSLWMRSISIRSCVVKRMTDIFTLNFFARPEKLERISFDPNVHIDADMAELIVRKFRNLRQIILYTEDVTEINNLQDEGTTNDTSSKLISRLDDQFQLTALDVKFDTSKWKLKWNIKMKAQISSTYTEVEDIMGPFGMSGIRRVPPSQDLSRTSLKTVTLSIPFVQDRDRFIWLKILCFQNGLTSLTCDLNATHWLDYEKIIRRNKSTLKKLFLLNIADGTKSFVSVTDEGTPFSWTIFDGCEELEDVTLIADAFIHSSLTNCSFGRSRHYMETENLSSLQCPKLRALWLENFAFSEEDADLLRFGNVDKKSKARFELCTLKNCKVGAENVAELQAGSKKGRNRCVECLCFGTMSYDDDEIDTFEKYAASKLAQINETKDREFVNYEDMDMIDCFHHASRVPEQKNKISLGQLVAGNFNLIGGIAFTAWLAWTE